MCFHTISLLFSKGKDACYRNEFQVGIYSVIKLMFTLGYNVHVCSCNLVSYKDPWVLFYILVGLLVIIMKIGSTAIPNRLPYNI